MTATPNEGTRARTPALILGLTALSLGLPPTATAQSADEAIGLAVLPLPATERATARVITRAGEVLRDGSGAFICVTDAPDEGFAVACYHESLEPYMARGRALAASGVSGRESLQTRWEEIEAGRLEMPDHPAALFQLRGDTAPTGGDLSGLERLTVLYVAFQDAAALGLPETPVDGLPWLMFSGRPTAHIMISG